MLPILILLAAQAASPPPESPTLKSRAGEVVHKGENLASTPAVDVGAKKMEIPEVLQQAAVNPYAAAGTASCAQIKSGLANLSEALGPDFEAGDDTKENRAGKLAEAGGKSLVNGLVPFRGLVREISGAAPAERRLNAAISAGHARRGFLHGVAMARKCKI
ncbi:hypothetical protein HL653_19815 [Sphingomonas sp. AP4-R1]|uniref:hypothetical protein n=1 Tax=Sphingomonas sp. AP4-R1 TaxID=2735134 RepID=UPI00159AEC14|nr:hypothetical protein [Sphingomonas sp. AP4-R1]QJU59699.1 hypothetical protein HL653_19815 [Sphingomonas sp. AP4-R1]